MIVNDRMKVKVKVSFITFLIFIYVFAATDHGDLAALIGGENLI